MLTTSPILTIIVAFGLLVPATSTVSAASPPAKKGLFSKIFNGEKAQARREARVIRRSRSTASTVSSAPRGEQTQRRGLFSSNRSSSRSSAPAATRPATTSSSSSSSSSTSSRPAVPASANVNWSRLAQCDRSNSRFVVDISKQRGYLLVNGQIAITTPVSTARPGKYTPRGTFYMSERVRHNKISTIYHVKMPYWMRLSSTPFGVHAGYLPGYPASAGCIRLPNSIAQLVYDHTRSGTRVNVYSSWSGS